MTFGATRISHRFGDVLALDEVDLDVPAGSVVALVGGDGAGKTTLLRCVAGLLRPAGGSVRRPDRREVGYMPATSGTWRHLTVDENIEFVGQSYAMTPESLDRRRTELLERAELTDAAGRLADDLSGGMRQKLGFVLAVLHRPQLLLLDEPSTGVDPVSRIELWRMIAEAASEGAAVAMATTYLDEAERASSITVLDAGHVLAVGSRDEVMSSYPGHITAPGRPIDPARAWRRGTAVREWWPDDTATGSAVPAGSLLGPEQLVLEDVVVARLLNRRAGGADPSEPARGGLDDDPGGPMAPDDRTAS